MKSYSVIRTKLNQMVFKNVHIITDLQEKHIYATTQLQTFLRVLRTTWRLKPAGIDIKQTYVTVTHTHTHTHLTARFSGTIRVSRYQKGKTNLDFTEARDSEWQWHQLSRMQVCTSLQTDNHASTPPLSFLQAGCPSCRPTNSVKALKATVALCILPGAQQKLGLTDQRGWRESPALLNEAAA